MFHDSDRLVLTLLAWLFQPPAVSSRDDSQMQQHIRTCW